MDQFQALANHSAKHPTRRLIQCFIKIKTEISRLEYVGIFPSTANAFIAALNHTGLCNGCITVIATRKIDVFDKRTLKKQS